MRATFLILTITLISWIQQCECDHRQVHQGHENGNRTNTHTHGKPRVHSQAVQDVPTSAAPLPASPTVATSATKADNASVSTYMNETKGNSLST